MVMRGELIPLVTRQGRMGTCRPQTGIVLNENQIRMVMKIADTLSLSLSS
jgi:hypothetical protein